MNKDDILKASRKENKNKDLAELEIMRHAGSISGSVGVMVCFMISLLSSILADVTLFSPWMIYFSIVGTNWLVRAIKTKTKSNWVIAVMFLVLAVLALIGFVVRLLEYKA